MPKKPVTRYFHVESGGSKRKHLGLVPFALIAFGVGSLALLSVPGSRASAGVEPHAGGTFGPTIPNRSLPPEGAPRLRRYNVLDLERFRWDGPPPGTFDIGLQTRSSRGLTYDVPFRFTGTIDQLNFKLGPHQFSAEDKKSAAIKPASAKD